MPIDEAARTRSGSPVSKLSSDADVLSHFFPFLRRRSCGIATDQLGVVSSPSLIRGGRRIARSVGNTHLFYPHLYRDWSDREIQRSGMRRRWLGSLSFVEPFRKGLKSISGMDGFTLMTSFHQGIWFFGEF